MEISVTTYVDDQTYMRLLYGTPRDLTRGRKKRKRRAGAGSAVGVKRHTRTPRGPNRGKPRVVVDGYRRGSGKRRKKRK